MSSQIFSAAVVGGGIVGLSIALELQRCGESVLLLERDTVCGGASYGNAGHIATEQVFPIASPDVLKQLPKMLLDPLGPLRLDWNTCLKSRRGCSACCTTLRPNASSTATAP